MAQKPMVGKYLNKDYYVLKLIYMERTERVHNGCTCGRRYLISQIATHSTCVCVLLLLLLSSIKQWLKLSSTISCMCDRLYALLYMLLHFCCYWCGCCCCRYMRLWHLIHVCMSYPCLSPQTISNKLVFSCCTRESMREVAMLQHLDYLKMSRLYNYNSSLCIYGIWWF